MKSDPSNVPKTESWSSWAKNKIRGFTNPSGDRGLKRVNHSLREPSIETEDVRNLFRSLSIAPGSSRSRALTEQRDIQYGRSAMKKLKR